MGIFQAAVFLKKTLLANQVRRRLVFLGVACGFFLVFQFAYLLFSPYVFYHEEQKVAALGKGLAKASLELPFWFYLDSPHLGGSVYAGVLSAPFYFFLGDQYFSLKISGLFLAGVYFWLWASFLISQYGELILLPLTIVFSLPTTRLLMHYSIRAGNALEMLMVISVMIILGFLFLKEKKIGLKRIFWLGFLASFGLWVQYGHSLAILTVLFFWFLKDKRFMLKREFLFFLFGAGVGLIPFLIYNLNYAWASFGADTIVDLGIFKIKGIAWWEKVKKFFLFILPRSFLMLGGGWGGVEIVSWIVYALIVLGILYLVYSAVRERGISFEKVLLFFLSLSIFMLNFLNLPLADFPNHFAKPNEVSVFAYYYPAFIQPFLLLAFVLLVFQLLKKDGWWRGLGLFFLLVYMIVAMGNYWENLTAWNQEELRASQVGWPSEKNLREVLPTFYLGSWRVNDFLFGPYDSEEANVYEAGYHYSRNKDLFKRLLGVIPEEYWKEYIYGAGCSLNRLLREEDWGDLDKENWRAILELLSPEEKAKFFSRAVVGEAIWFGGEKRIYVKSYQRLRSILSEEDQLILDEKLVEMKIIE